MDTQKWIDEGYNLIVEYGPKILGAILIWIIGAYVIKIIRKGIRNAMTKAEYDESLKKFLLNLINWILKIVLIIVVLGTMGVETTSFAAIIAAVSTLPPERVMSVHRLLVLGATVVLLAASCGQKGPLTLPEDGSLVRATADAGHSDRTGRVADAVRSSLD